MVYLNGVKSAINENVTFSRQIWEKVASMWRLIFPTLLVQSVSMLYILNRDMMGFKKLPLFYTLCRWPWTWHSLYVVHFKMR
jgi:hypothetical protein